MKFLDKIAEFIVESVIAILGRLRFWLWEGNKVRQAIFCMLVVPLIVCGIPFALWQDFRRLKPLKILDNISLWFIHLVERWRDSALTWLEPGAGCDIHTIVYLLLMILIVIAPCVIWASCRGVLFDQHSEDRPRWPTPALRDETPRVWVRLKVIHPTHNWRKEGF